MGSSWRLDGYLTLRSLINIRTNKHIGGEKKVKVINAQGGIKQIDSFRDTSNIFENFEQLLAKIISFLFLNDVN